MMPIQGGITLLTAYFVTMLCLPVFRSLTHSSWYPTEKEAAAAADYVSYKLRGPTAPLNLGLTASQRCALDRMSLEQLQAFIKSKGDVFDLGSGVEGGASTAATGDGGEAALQRQPEPGGAVQGGPQAESAAVQQLQQQQHGAVAGSGKETGARDAAGAERETEGKDAAAASEAAVQQQQAAHEQEDKVQQGGGEGDVEEPQRARGRKRCGQAQEQPPRRVGVRTQEPGGPSSGPAGGGESGSGAVPSELMEGPAAAARTVATPIPSDSMAPAAVAAAAAAAGSSAAANAAAADVAEAPSRAPAAPSAQAGGLPAALPPSDGRPGASYRYIMQCNNKYRCQVYYNGGRFTRWAVYQLAGAPRC